jgi:hypothetical protein
MPTKPTGRYVLDTFVNRGNRNIYELAAALVSDGNFSEVMKKGINKDVQLFLNSIPAELGVGDVSSNLRYKNDKNVNHAVVKTTISFLEHYRMINENPVVVTAYPRSQRYYSFKMNEDGSVVVKNNVSSLDEGKQEILNKFLKIVGLDSSKRQKMRLSSEGAHFYTFLADVLSLIVQMNYYYHPEMFEEVSLTPDPINSSTRDIYGNLRLNPVESSSGRIWKPKPNFDYLYFSKEKTSQTQKYMIPKEGSIQKVYHQFWELLDDKENGAKKMIREHFANVNEWKRWSDYSVNDVDDGITACVVLHSHMTVPNEELNDLEKRSKDKFQEIVDTWFGDLTQ